MSHGAFTNSPIFARSDVKRTSGTTAKESWRLRITWLRISSLAVPDAPYRMATIAAGTIAIPRVIRRRSHGRSRMWRNPSITIWPASVPVSVEFCPDASRASAKTTLAPRRAEQRRQQLVGILDLGDVGVAGRMKRGRSDDQDRGIDEERERERDRRVENGVANRLALAGRRLLVAPRLHDRTSAGRGCAA